MGVSVQVPQDRTTRGLAGGYKMKNGVEEAGEITDMKGFSFVVIYVIASKKFWFQLIDTWTAYL